MRASTKKFILRNDKVVRGAFYGRKLFTVQSFKNNDKIITKIFQIMQNLAKIIQ